MTITIKQADHSNGSQRLYNVCLVGPMDKAPVYGTGDSGFESPAGLPRWSNRNGADCGTRNSKFSTWAKRNIREPTTTYPVSSVGRAQDF